MPLSQQVCSLEYAQRLKKLGVKQESLWAWWITTDVDDTPSLNRHPDKDCLVCGHPKAPYFDWISAFTVSELGGMLWDSFEKHGWELLYVAYGNVFDFKGTQRIGELGIINLMRHPDMAAKMLIYLLENGLLKL